MKLPFPDVAHSSWDADNPQLAGSIVGRYIKHVCRRRDARRHDDSSKHLRSTVAENHREVNEVDDDSAKETIDIDVKGIRRSATRIAHREGDGIRIDAIHGHLHLAGSCASAANGPSE